ncbi:hypothetical protein HELRODRAFT_109357 [Helobdella robusta]|uniref:BTB domain-containing protein n=1 Tax=Helobdella robusta TaxID=6412 RepID=T1EES7_HELRO|nr:hypothetical protein HELRODRAFT_109357 [Helobdella robusta]ESO09936.1 hypothetical protein HELRODRAFT_109357 [Helobdella robusta]
MTSNQSSSASLQLDISQTPSESHLLEERLRLNVSGQYFDVRLAVLEKHPDTLLGNKLARSKYYDPLRKEFFFDRHRPTFEVIFSYYLHGKKLHRPNLIPEDVFLDELFFFQIEKHVINDYKRQEGHSEEEEELPQQEEGLKKCFWDLFEHPKSSKPALIVALTSVTMTIIAIVLLCVETLPQYKKFSCLASVRLFSLNFLDISKNPFFIIESVCNVWFTIEVVVRLASCPSKINFIKDFKNIVDILSIVPYYVTVFTLTLTKKDCLFSQNSSDALAFLRVIRLVRIFKLTKHSIGLQVLVLTFKASIEGLGMFFATLIVCMLLYSSALYYAEANYKGHASKSVFSVCMC